MVRLKVVFLAGEKGKELDFNSSMVRLKVLMRQPVQVMSPTFQFLYGAIKSIQALNSTFKTIISIPLWCD